MLFIAILNHKTVSSRHFFAQNVRKVHFNDLSRYFWVTNGGSWLSQWSTTSKTSVKNIIITSGALLNYDFRGHSIIKPYLASNPQVDRCVSWIWYHYTWHNKNMYQNKININLTLLGFSFVFYFVLTCDVVMVFLRRRNKSLFILWLMFWNW